MNISPVEIADRKVGPGHPCFIVGEGGVNHNGDMDMARRLVDAAVEAGCDAVKFQAYETEKYVTPDTPKADYSLDTTDTAESHFEMIRRLELSPDNQREIMGYAHSKGIIFMSSPFEEDASDLLEELGVPAFKIPSGELTNLPYLAHIARKGIPMIVSTGMSYLGEVETAVQTIKGAGNTDIVLLHCVSRYPAPLEDVNLRAMHTMEAAFNLPVGYSDHTLGVEVPIAAVALGACVIEKHLTLDRELPGPDHRASAEPDVLKAMVKGIRGAEAALGHGRKEPVPLEANTADVARKSLVAAQDIAAGTTLSQNLVAIKRPGTGLAPATWSLLEGRTVRVDVSEGALLSLDMLT